MIVLFNNEGREILRTNQPTSDQQEKGYNIDQLDEPTPNEGQKAILYLDANNEPYYEYVDVIPSEEKRIKDLEDTVAQLMLGGM